MLAVVVVAKAFHLATVMPLNKPPALVVVPSAQRWHMRLVAGGISVGNWLGKEFAVDDHSDCALLS